MSLRDRFDIIVRLLPTYLLALVPVIVATVGVALLGVLELANASMLYLGAVLIVAVFLGRGPAIAASIAAFLTFNFLFVEPTLTFTVASPDEVLGLFTFLLVAIVTGQLAARLRVRAQDAEAREREARLLFDLSTMLASQRLRPALEAVAERLRVELHVQAVAVELRDPESGLAKVVVGDAEAAQLARRQTASVQVLGTSAQAGASRGGPGRWVRVSPPRGARQPAEDRGVIRVPIRIGGSDPVGDLVLVTARDARTLPAPDARLLATSANQLALAIEQDRLRQEATDAELLRRTDELRSALIDAVAHDLRTPLASIIASAGSLRQADVTWSDAERREFIQAIEDEAERLNRIVGNLLDLSRIQGGSLVPSRDWHDVGLVIRDSVARLRPVIGSQRVEVDLPPDLGPAFVDPVELDQVVANLIENAAKYAPQGGMIRLSAERDSEELRVRVDDQGPGIPAATLPHLFEPFYRAPGTSRIPGSGLGLAVARGLVEAHGGRIWAENRPSGGARFTFTIPTSRLAVEVEA
ncbi:MAG TPA: ATP-binding protein [Candidatus Limnocylindria bacterium]|jgi:two-component system sensor histidine kinase KdpD